MSRGIPIYYDSCQGSTVAPAMAIAVWRCGSHVIVLSESYTTLGFYKCLIDMKYSSIIRDNLQSSIPF